MAATKLLVFVLGLGRRRDDELMQRLTSEFGAEWRIEIVPNELRLFSHNKLDDAVNDLVASIAEFAGDSTGERADTTDIVLCGHSLGGLLVRAAFVDAMADPAAFNDGEKNWARKVRRVVLLGSPNAGFDPTHLPWLWQVVYWVFCQPRTKLLVEQIRAGGYWITNLRLGWAETVRDRQDVHVVQVLASDDELVHERDVEDSRYLGPTSTLWMSRTDHSGMVDLTHSDTAESRWEVLRNAIAGNDLPRVAPLPVSHDPVVFIVHGIRASAHEQWVSRATTAMQARGGGDVHIQATNYGFFSAIQFALPFTRRGNVKRFLRDYGRWFTTHDADNFHFLGHSNGTYMLGKALQEVRTMRFTRVLLAGSVLPPDYDWSARVDAGQVLQVRNDRASHDFPVGILCSLLNGLNQDVGRGGYTGFVGLPVAVSQPAATFPKGHGSALEDHTAANYPPRMPEVAEFLLEGTLPPDPLNTQKLDAFMRLSNAVGVTLFGAIVLLAIPTLIIGALVGWAHLTVLAAIAITAAILAVVYVVMRSV